MATPAPSVSATAMTSSAASDGAGADQDRDLLAGVEDFRGLAQVGFGGTISGPRIAGTRAREAVRALGRLERLFLHVLGNDDHRRRAARDRQADRAVDHVRQLRRMADLLHIFGDVGEHPVEVELLLVARAADGRSGLAADGEHRHVVELGVVEPGDEVGRARAAGREAHAELAGELGVRHRHERRHLLVPRLDEVDRRHRAGARR